MKLPLVERLRLIRDRLDLIGEQGDTEALEEAIKLAEADAERKKQLGLDEAFPAS